MAKRGSFLKNIACLALAAALLMAPAGCGTKGNEDAKAPTQEPSSGTPLPTGDPSGSETGFDKTPYEGLVFSRVYGNSAKKDAATSAGFIELYNSGDSDIDCSALAIYYKSPTVSSYKQFLFNNTTIPAHSYYLIKCARNSEFDKSSEIISIDSFDAFWNIGIGDEVSLILTSKDAKPSPDALPEEFTDAISYLRATDSYTFDTGCTDGLSKYKYAVRVALIPDSGWEIVDLMNASSVKLRSIVPKYSGGAAGEVRRCAINEVDFDHDPGFYDSQISLGLKAAEGSSIYYTTDGSDPRTSGTRRLYMNSLTLKDTTEMKIGSLIKNTANAMGGSYNVPSGVKKLPGCYVIKACSELSGEYSEVFTGSYFISSLYNDFNVTVMSVSMDESEMIGDNGFYNHYYASENLQNPRGSGVMEVFGRDLVRHGCSNIELSVSGHGSSGAPMKSMKVFFKKSDNEGGGTEDKLYYDLFDGYSFNEKGQRITDFARLLLRNSGNDYGLTYIRDAFMQRAARILKADTMAYAPTLLFINGCFWGVYNARERYSGDYVESHHGIDKDNVAIIESDYSQVHTDQNAPFVLTSGLDSDPDAFNTLMEYIRSRDLSVQKNFDYVASKIDLDSFIDMYVARLYFNAIDWPENNIKIWRNRAGDGDPSNYDTKWHFTLLDTDFGVGFYDNITATKLTIWGAMHGTHCIVGTIMHKLLANDAFKDRFVYRFYEVASKLFTPEYLGGELDVIVNERAPFVYLQTDRWGASKSNYRNGVATMREFIQNRQAFVIDSFLKEMGYSEATLHAMVNNEANLTYWYSQIEKAYINGEQITNNTYYSLENGPVELEIVLTVRSNYQLSSVTYKTFGGNVIKTIDVKDNKDNILKLTIDEPCQVAIVCSKKR